MIEAAVQAALRAIPEVAAIVDDRIYPTTLPADAILPAISYRGVDEPVPGQDNDDGGELARPRFEVNCWALDYLVAVALADAVRPLRLVSGVIAGETIDHVDLDNTHFFYEADRKLHRICREFIVWGVV
jgi:hypothetical protein